MNGRISATDAHIFLRVAVSSSGSLKRNRRLGGPIMIDSGLVEQLEMMLDAKAIVG